MKDEGNGVYVEELSGRFDYFPVKAFQVVIYLLSSCYLL